MSFKAKREHVPQLNAIGIIAAMHRTNALLKTKFVTLWLENYPGRELLMGIVWPLNADTCTYMHVAINCFGYMYNCLFMPNIM